LAPLADDRRRLSKPALALVSVILVGFTVAGYVGDALAPTLIDSRPALLLFLNPRNRNLVLITNQLDALTYYTLGAFRLMVADPLFYLIGYRYGDAAVRWVERKTPSYGQLLRSLERAFAKASYVLIVVAPNAYLCLFAGAAGMRVITFAVLNVIGTFGRLYLIRVFGEAFDSPIDVVVDFIVRYRIPFLILTVGLVAFSIWNERRQVGESKVESLSHLEEELEAAEQEVEAEHREAEHQEAEHKEDEAS
jgi:membrane protein DedA with SNARE-associated domain